MNCNPEILATLVRQSREPGEEINSVAEHLEQCDSCRRELARLGGEAAMWIEAQTCLSHSDPETDDREDSLWPQSTIDLSFLEPATHPEMLGRIGRYEVESLLGHGGMGVVFRAYDSDLQRAVAVKVLAPHWAMSPTARQRFAREAEAAASVAHENVIPIYNVDANAKLPYLVMRYVPGMTLQRWVRTHGPLSVGTILRVAGQLAEGLAAAHRRGLVHRDIKPGNVLVGENIERIWITDFGLARAADSVTLTQTGVIAGTPHYMSPEQARGQPIDHRSDLFSLGCVLYFLCAGRPPFDADNTLAVLHKIVTEDPLSLAQLRDDLPPHFVRLVHSLLQRSIDHRPQDCPAVIHEIANSQTEQQRGPRHSWTRSRWQDATARQRRLVVGALTALLVVSTWGVSQLAIRYLNYDTQPRYPSSVGSRAPAAASLVNPAQYDPGRKFTRAADRIASSLDDPRLDRRYRDLEQRIAKAAQPVALTGANALLRDPFTTEKNWDRDVSATDKEIERLMKSGPYSLVRNPSNSR
ncbi:serine/threonine-protein kinase [Allorhodopirellula heiligendammensis]|uniref:non-specific serine/threonine protein kinase n=1 Tax=Allorhodopirellula heiligendammensis TaxID=2714739 RepID=A0A5C6BX39_9BACT|nr:serine/threonine-protein kinase [Allorhodopirellula heiligendammensis]TWU16217.1 Serine/threonine-protein kinase PknB [Allorhodopirellula heiligendammensis]